MTTKITDFGISHKLEYSQLYHQPSDDNVEVSLNSYLHNICNVQKTIHWRPRLFSRGDGVRLKFWKI
jgi:hypothetical protein